MKRAIGILFILIGIGVLISSGYLFPETVHHLKIGEDLLPPDQPGTNWVPYVSGIITLIGVVVLLLSKANTEENYYHHSH